MGRVIRKTQVNVLDEDNLRRATASAVGSSAGGFELDMRLREFEISQLTQRNNFFMIFQAVMIAGLIQSQGTAAPWINFSVCLTGALLSMFQIGMAGGAKYWQSRWESAARSSEIAIVLELLAAKKNTIRTFTHDLKLLSDEEKVAVAEWVKDHPPPQDGIDDLNGFIHERVTADIAGKSNQPIRRRLDWWVRTWGISPKWSVSRIPLWVGAVLLIFWMSLWVQTWRLPFLADLMTCECGGIMFTPLKKDLPQPR